MFDIIIQIILAIFLILIMGFIAYSVYDREYINSVKIFNTNKKQTIILDGIYEYNQTPTVAETVNREDPRYMDINPSVNQNGGAEYSYNFWLYYNIKNSSILDTDNSNKYITLFYKGTRSFLPYNQFKYSCDTANENGGSITPKNYLIVKNPLVKISNDGKQVIVEYNNINHPDTFNSTSSKLNCTSGNIYDSKENKLGIKDIDTNKYNKTYNMITIVMQENPNNEDELFVNRTNCKIYFNGTLIADRSTLDTDLANDKNPDSYSTVMKKNGGYLYINPHTHFIGSSDIISTAIPEILEEDDITKDVPLKIAGLSYFNYALSSDEIIKLYNKRFTTNIIKLSNTNTKLINIGDKVNFDIYDGEDSNKIPVKPI